jgi:hypothetical protein
MMPGMRPQLGDDVRFLCASEQCGGDITKAQPISYALSHGIPRRANRLPIDAG